MTKNLFVSFSGGATSGYMTKLLKDEQEKTGKYDDIVYMFANTGLEDERTLDFVNECDVRWDLGLVWVEAVVHHGERKAPTHKRVTYETATRGWAIFEEVIKKYGVPNMARPACTRDLKLAPFKSYFREIGWQDYFSAVGIRADEMDRIPENPMKGYIYPMADAGIRKKDVAAWWAKQDFKLDLPEHYGNCVSCWKKTNRKKMTLIKEGVTQFAEMAEIEKKYGHVNCPNFEEKGPLVFHRGNLSTFDLIEMAKKPFVPFTEFIDTQEEFNFEIDELDLSGGCDESCEVF